jgi:hypothetical protein
MGNIDMRPAYETENTPPPADEKVVTPIPPEETSTTEGEDDENGLIDIPSDNGEQPPEESSTSKEPVKPVTPPQDPDADEEKAINALKQQREQLMKDIVELRRERRQVRDQKPEPLIIPAEGAGDDMQIAEADLKLIELAAKRLGLVRKDEAMQMQQTATYQEKLDTYKNEWLNQHPEYLPENDPDDKNWNQLKSTIDTYFKAPGSPKEIVKVLDAAHKMVNPHAVLPIRQKASVDAAKEKITSASKAVGTGTSSKSGSPQKRGGVNAGAFVGFSEEEINELLS